MNVRPKSSQVDVYSGLLEVKSSRGEPEEALQRCAESEHQEVQQLCSFFSRLTLPTDYKVLVAVSISVDGCS